MLHYDPKLKKLARELRKQGVLSEVLLWQQLKGKNLCGFDFHRQKPIDNYIVDFYCPQLKLAIEIDGESHRETYDKDQERQARLELLGVTILRFRDEDVKTNLEGVLHSLTQWIQEHVSACGANTPRLRHPSQEGKGAVLGCAQKDERELNNKTVHLEQLLTESRNPNTLDIDKLPTLDIVTSINCQDQLVPLAVAQVLPQVAQAVDWIVEAMEKGGRLFYLGAGTSGRLGILDASECPPTFGTQPELIQGLIAGGQTAMFRAVEGAEDSLTLAAQDLADCRLSASDIVIGIAASGRTPYVIGGLQHAKQTGCRTVALVCSPNSEMAAIADITICVEAGPEVIMGSTRLKAGTAQKLVLNMLTTATMIRRGKVYSNLMVDVQATNTKLIERAKRIVILATGATTEQAEIALEEAGGSAKVAIVMLLADVIAEEAKVRLQQANGFVAKAIRNEGNG